ncbi:MAG: hypothetical protein ACQGVC_21700 [Myxococcota bacterium]
MRPFVVLALASALLIGCRTAPESSIRDIDVPRGLSAAEVEFAILATLAEKPPPEDLRPSERIADHAFKAWFGPFYRSIQPPTQRWFLEAREPDYILAGYQGGSHYLRLRIEYSADRIHFVVEDTRNLRRYSDRIHKTAIRWIQDLEVSLRRALGRLSMESP